MYLKTPVAKPFCISVRNIAVAVPIMHLIYVHGWRTTLAEQRPNGKQTRRRQRAKTRRVSSRAIGVCANVLGTDDDNNY